MPKNKKLWSPFHRKFFTYDAVEITILIRFVLIPIVKKDQKPKNLF